MTDSKFAVVAQSLDNKRLGKQRVEAYQILNSLTGKSNGWTNHPATKMWQGHEWQLANYGYEICGEWINRGFKDSLEQKFWLFMNQNQKSHKPKPWWVKDSLVHLTHQSKHPTSITMKFQTIFLMSGQITKKGSFLWEP
jgi:hypothetical protein